MYIDEYDKIENYALEARFIIKKAIINTEDKYCKKQLLKCSKRLFDIVVKINGN